MTHAYTAVTYDSDRGLFMNINAQGKHWKPGYYKGIIGEKEIAIYAYHPETNEWEVVSEQTNDEARNTRLSAVARRAHPGL